MDFVKLVEGGQYTREGLTPEQLARVEGMDLAIDTLKDVASWKVCGKDESLSMQLYCEIERRAIQEAIGALYSQQCAMIVACADEGAGAAAEGACQ